MKEEEEEGGSRTKRFLFFSPFFFGRPHTPRVCDESCEKREMNHRVGRRNRPRDSLAHLCYAPCIRFPPRTRDRERRIQNKTHGDSVFFWDLFCSRESAEIIKIKRDFVCFYSYFILYIDPIFLYSSIDHLNTSPHRLHSHAPFIRSLGERMAAWWGGGVPLSAGHGKKTRTNHPSSFDYFFTSMQSRANVMRSETNRVKKNKSRRR